MDEDKPARHWFSRIWRALCGAKKIAREQNPGGILRLAHEVAALAEAASRVCPPERKLQTRIASVREESRRLAEMADTPDFRRLDSAQRQTLHRDLVNSREHLLRVMGQAEAPTRLLQ